MAIPKFKRFEHHARWQAYLTFNDYLQAAVCILMKTPSVIIRSVSDVCRGNSTSTNILVSKKRVTLEPVQHKESHVKY